MKRRTLTIMAAMAVILGGFFAASRVSSGVAQDATGTAAAATGPITTKLTTVDGKDAGTATFTPGADGAITVKVSVQNLSEGTHGIHVHAWGVCEAAGDKPFDSAGGHFNPGDALHGGPPAAMKQTATSVATPGAVSGHAGDLGNIKVDKDGKGTLEVVTDRFTLAAGDLSLQDKNGSSVVIHAKEDDLKTDPSGKSGARVACGVIAPSTIPAPDKSGTPKP
jgi:Cu-Zn family superoxide dismutase